jgi:CheY-like chemotaxis protein
MDKRPTVLCVEDGLDFQASYRQRLGERVTVLQATTLKEGFDLFRAHTDIGLIIMDACVPGDRPNTEPLVQHIRASGFHGPIIATSSMPSYRHRLLQAGCDHEVDSKAKVARKVLELLKIP